MPSPEDVKVVRLVSPVAARVLVVRLVVDAVDAVKIEVKRLVVVALVPVALTKVKFWRVVEPERRRFERLVRPETVSDVKEPAPDALTIQLLVIAKHPAAMSMPLANVEVEFLVTVRRPVLSAVVEAIPVTARLVVVADVVVLLNAVKP